MLCLPRLRSLSFLAPRKFGLIIPPPVTEVTSLRRLKLIRIASKQFSPLLLPPGFGALAPSLTELVLECADWPAIPQVCVTAGSPRASSGTPALPCETFLREGGARLRRVPLKRESPMGPYPQRVCLPHLAGGDRWAFRVVGTTC